MIYEHLGLSLPLPFSLFLYIVEGKNFAQTHIEMFEQEQTHNTNDVMRDL